MADGIVLFHLGRCGSTVLGNLLAQHSNITWRGEIIEPLMQAARKQQGEPYYLSGDPASLALNAVANCSTRFCGVEFKPYHLAAYGIPMAEFIASLRNAGLSRFVLLDRRNRLRKIVSSRLAARTGIWHVPINASRRGQAITIEVGKFSLDRKTGALADVLAMYDAEFVELRELLSPSYLDLIYEEDIEADPQLAYRKVIEFLGLAAEPVTTKLGRTTAAPLRDLITNFDAVARHLAGTKYAWMLEG